MNTLVGWRRFCDLSPESGALILCKGECLTSNNVYIVYAVKSGVAPGIDPMLSPDITLHSWIYLSEVEILIRKQVMVTAQ